MIRDCPTKLAGLQSLISKMHNDQQTPKKGGGLNTLCDTVFAFAGVATTLRQSVGREVFGLL